jgi:methionyl-tRNA formyltransferase
LPTPVLDVPRLGCINLHASLLPRWRGAAPIERAVLAGDTVTGVSLFRMEAGLDTGPVYARAEVPIGPATRAADLHETLSNLAADILIPTLAGLVDGSIVGVPQTELEATYATKLTRDEGRLDFTRSATELDRMIRALEPRPGAFVLLGGERLGVRSATIMHAQNGVPGQVVEPPLVVACGEDALRLNVVQRPGKKAMPAAELLRGWHVPPGTRFDPV